MSGVELAARLERDGFALDLELSVAEGEVLAVLGPNGAGKSTMLGVVSGLLRPDSGHLRVGGRTLLDTATGAFVPAHRRGVGLLAQEALLFPHLSALANVAFGPRAQGTPRAEADERARGLLGDVGVGELAARRPAQLSGGQQQRVALARALAPRPGLLLLDEPLAALDVDATPAMRTLLRRVIADAKQTALLVTHDALDALVLADRVVVLDRGRIVEQGPARDVLARPRSPFSARIAGLDLVPGTADGDGIRTADGVELYGRAVEVAYGEPAVAVFPPSAVSVHVDRPDGSPRNVFRVRVAALEPRGDAVRLRAAAPAGGPAWTDGLAADVTPAAVADLGVEPGHDVWFAVKATEVAVHGRLS
ncbi:Molybdenum transport ATP-binding protein ModC [Pseudonocardia sp. Ae168_Ps1]|uniref:sulfate/molybdate ABC transporter ATP-binding protein n=1 Tax=unclassified Pseudonocardia TaxID=2619320 RepID=UPI00094ADF3A|nr:MULTISPECIES: ABC transporter ATP-binding protein [unclassified Pseudonocardia]OLL74391.1 Molybdenum transport ATP-binding protein ModC [Pseudonocardia sp. Ae150A_Ps1]OLL80371.1 Molybdenum transport ATP-binding protein ModC [Pseudonocardia sp. Ae168_Ps1]OLL85502.1 Molybdenum transport ATP-binding protein ModC [Pseudonocardia sp. Ae263_Ps1]OLL94471.1 Molybdenum transport ATP-binding protein ModC [Pseudonocardia sp. Ae356_Ps1]